MGIGLAKVKGDSQLIPQEVVKESKVSNCEWEGSGSALGYCPSWDACMPGPSLIQGHSNLILNSTTLPTLLFCFSAETLGRLKGLSCPFCSKQSFLKSHLISDSTLGVLERLFPSQESHLNSFGGWTVRQVCKDFGTKMERNFTKPFALLCAALYGWMVNNLGMICNGILGPKEYPMGVSFWTQTLLLGTA